MSDIRKRAGKCGATYQVRYANSASRTGFSYRTFKTAKEARAFRESGQADRNVAARGSAFTPLSVDDAVDEWLEICEKEGLNGRDPVTAYTMENYRYRATFITGHPWAKTLTDLTSPDIVAFRSSLLRSGISRDLAGKVLSSFQSMMKEMVLRNRLTTNCAAGIGVRADSRYDEPIVVPSMAEIKALLHAADDLSNCQNQTIAKPWARYRPMLYLAIDSGMRPQEYLAAAKSALSANGIRVERAIEGDGGKISVPKTPTGRRHIDLSQGTLDMVRHYAENVALPNAHDLIFPDKSGKWQSRRNWQRRGFNVACEKAGLMTQHTDANGVVSTSAKFRPYDLRHFFASYHIAKKTNLKKLQKMMGHKDIETTLNVYGHLLDDDDEASKGVLDALL